MHICIYIEEIAFSLHDHLYIPLKHVLFHKPRHIHVPKLDVIVYVFCNKYMSFQLVCLVFWYTGIYDIK